MSNDLIVIEDLKAIDVFSGDGLDSVLDSITKEVKSFVPDMTTEDGRKQIASNAYKVARSKTTLDELGKSLVEKQKAEIKAVDASRKKMRDYLDGLRDEVRKPLNDWEEKDKQRIANHKSTIEGIEKEGELIAEYWIDYELDGMMRILARIESINVDDLDEFTVKAQAAKKQAVINVKHGISEHKAHHEEKLKAEAEAKKAEAERVKAEEMARKHREKQIAIDAAKNAKREAEAKAKAELDKVEASKKAAEDAKANAERQAVETAKRVELEKQQAAEQAEREKQAAIKAEQDKAAKAEADRKAIAEAERVKAEKAASNKAHKKRVNNAALKCFTDNGIAEAMAKEIIVLIASGKIENVSINY